ncbi:biotin-[acetyl-CoA-carboxylase] ligase [Aliarcobacter faecis]|uniref:biotin--[acetyl-CoA-carboxylase] ligase n=1 Tax=Aliarcobacter faecis TaxID=1564138 RepID=UPI00047DCE21|nr:biotin--[acetyl-CoA-carboxylase] ligase [Aliarcobacter faecis]QKF73835.1 biotin-[acetyl-CoA-carboxylase] ligase [Aliarcobacter faecis]
MKIIRLNEVDSTQTYLKNYILELGYKNPLCIVTDFQTAGIGSRGNSWIGKKGNLFFSFVLEKNLLPKDLPIQSASIYFTYILKLILQKNGSNVWVKWPNDFYIKESKIGGTITTLSKDLLYCGIGINLQEVSDEYGVLDIRIDQDLILFEYFKEIEKIISWKQIFSLFKIEFQNSKKYKTTVNNQKISLEYATLNDDGSIHIENKKVFSLR